MKTHPLLRVTETGAVEYHPAYPVEPEDYCCDMGDIVILCQNTFCRCEAILKKHRYDIEQAESGFLPVQNKEYAEQCINPIGYWYEGVNPGIYPYTGEVKISEACNSDCCSDDGGCEHCQKPIKVAILVEKPEVKEEPEYRNFVKPKVIEIVGIDTAISKLTEKDKEIISLKTEIESLRTANKELVELIDKALSYGYHAAKDELKGIPSIGYGDKFKERYKKYFDAM